MASLQFVAYDSVRFALGVGPDDLKLYLDVLGGALQQQSAIGIGGIGMSALARYFVANGKQVAGYDNTATAITKGLPELGFYIHCNDNIIEVDPKY